MPNSIGYQDIAAAFTREPLAQQRGEGHLIASPFGTIEPATFSYGRRPVGTSIPEPPAIMFVNFDARTSANTWAIDAPLPVEAARPIVYPTVNRRMKGDRLPSSAPPPAPAQPETLPQLEPIESAPAAQPPAAPETPPPVPSPRPKSVDAATPATPAAEQTRHTGMADLPDLPPELPAAGEIDTLGGSVSSLAVVDDAGQRSAQLYFGAGMLSSPVGLEPWAPGAEPVMVAASAEAGIKLSALEGAPPSGTPGETLAAKDDATQMQGPAERLGLAGKPRARAEKCLADAVYFEARGEPLRGQQAVAQVVMNRVFSGYYPNNVCGVVYQNAGRYLACQFTFACEGKNLNRIAEPGMWEQAKRIAKDTLDGKIWLPDIGHATHYHAYWVHPSWVHEMTRLYKLGVHTFYRPRAWGKGDEEPVWGEHPATSKSEDSPAKPQANAAPDKPNKDDRTAKL